ncbi:MAG: tetratricopeptide repeat protein [Deltaproteobacteria bacterium]|nr:tetratricopeptide repeat protein [Deltaproteobacteria bacterium]
MTSRKIASNVKWAVVIYILSFPLIWGRVNSVMASDVTYQRDYTYQASESDSKISCRTIALEQVKRLLLEELGSYLVSQTEVKNYQISRDQVNAITAGIVKTEVLKENWDGKTFYIIAKITTDPSQVAKAVDELRKDKQGLSELEEVKKRTEELLIGLERLREELKLSKGGQQIQEKKDYMAAVQQLDAVDWFREGYALAESGKYRDAISFYNKAIDADPRHATAYSARGWAYHRIGDYPSALKDNNRALDLKPNFPAALANRSTTLWGMRQYDKALADINRAIELKPDYSRAYEVRSLIYLYMKKSVNAIEDGNKAIELNPNNAYAYLHRGDAYRNIGSYEEAFKDYQKTIEITPANPNVYHSRGYAYFLRKKYDDALRDMNKALDLNKDPVTPLFSPVTALYLRGLVCNQLKDHEGAIRDFSKVIEFEADNAGAYYQRSLSYKQIGKADESASDLKKAAQFRDVQAQKAVKK